MIYMHDSKTNTYIIIYTTLRRVYVYTNAAMLHIGANISVQLVDIHLESYRYTKPFHSLPSALAHDVNYSQKSTEV